jgi:hypothetical protein
LAGYPFPKPELVEGDDVEGVVGGVGSVTVVVLVIVVVVVVVVIVGVTTGSTPKPLPERQRVIVSQG